LHTQLQQLSKAAGLGGKVRINKSGCLDQCEHGPTVVVYPEAVWYGNVKPEDAAEIVEEHLVGGRPVERLRLAELGVREHEELPAPGDGGASAVCRGRENRAAPVAANSGAAGQRSAQRRALFLQRVRGQSVALGQGFLVGYLDLLVACRFNRFCLAFGLEYDFPRGVTSDYLHFPYPYLVNVPGYRRARDAAGCRGRNRAARAGSAERSRTADESGCAEIHCRADSRARLHFQLGSGRTLTSGPTARNAYHSIEGLTQGDARSYCRDALAMLLKQCPEIQGLTHARAWRKRDS
jgi:(2Fe-2S) ferredoxin